MATLPSQFSDLEPFVARWAQPNEASRLHTLQHSSIDELRVFYDAVFPRADQIKDYLWEKDLQTLSEPDRTLFHLLMTFIETAHPIELNWKVTDIDASLSHAKLEIADIRPDAPKA